MARNGGISVSASRFACLKIEDDEDAKETVVQKNSQQSINNANRKKNKKKKEQKETKELQQLAFGGRKASGKRSQGQNGHNMAAGDGRKSHESWEQWREHDEEVVEEQFKDDLAKALLQSRLETEQQEQEKKKQKERIAAGLEAPPVKDGKKKKKQKDKPQPMSLEQFNQLPKEKIPNSSDESDNDDKKESEVTIQTRVPTTQQDPKFFNSVMDDAEQILRQERMQEEYRKHFASDNAIVAKLKYDLELKDKKISELEDKMKEMAAEFKQIKKRNKQYCTILAQGEMKDKAQVLQQVNDLTIVKDELTDQVTALTAELEKEKSKNHGLKAELEKLRGSKHTK